MYILSSVNFSLGGCVNPASASFTQPLREKCTLHSIDVKQPGYENTHLHLPSPILPREVRKQDIHIQYSARPSATRTCGRELSLMIKAPFVLFSESTQLFVLDCQCNLHPDLSTGRSNWILHRKLKYSICCPRGVSQGKKWHR